MALAAGALLTIGVSSESGARQTGHAAAIVPSGAFDTLKEMNRRLKRIIDHDLKGDELKREVARVETLKKELVKQDFADQKVFGLSFSTVFFSLTGIDDLLAGAKVDDANGHDKAKLTRVKGAKRLKDSLETRLLKANQTPQTVMLFQDDTWMHNPDIGKSNVCINVRTSPPQAEISATLDGPGGYHAHLPKTPLDKPGSIQIKSEITQNGDYTDNLIVYDSSGKQTATATKTFTVLYPQNGPATTPPCPKPIGQSSFSAAIVNPGYDHTTPGNPSSTYPSTVCFNLTTTPSHPGAAFTATITPGAPAGPSRSVTGTLTYGQALVVFGIPAYGMYTVSATVTASGFQASTGSTTINAHEPPPSMTRSCAGGHPG